MIFIIGNIWFWVLMCVIAFLEIYFLEFWDEPGEYGEGPNGTGATILVIATFGVLFFLGSNKEIKEFFLYIYNNPGRDIFYFSIYIIAGIIWSLFKWFQYVLFLKREYQENIKNFTEESLKNSSRERDIIKKIPNPNALNNKGTLFTWIFYWPFSVIGYILNEPLKKIFNFIINNIKGLYQKITDKVLADIKTPNI